MLNPGAPPFFPSPYIISSEPFYQDVSFPPPLGCFYLDRSTVTTPLLPPPPTPPPFLNYQQQSYVFEVAREDVHHLLSETNITNCEKQGVDSKSVSKPRFIGAIISGCGRRRMEARQTNGSRRRPIVKPSCDQQIQERTSGNFRVSTRKNRTRHPLVPVQPEGNTTIMIRNIPNKYTRAMLIDFLDDHCLTENQKQPNEEEGEEHTISAYDLVYLPIDFSTRMNKGYAFVNFTNPEGAWKFYLATKNKKWKLFQSQKVCDIVAARLQGKEKLASHLSSMSFPSDWDEVLPACFSPPRDGTTKGSQRTLGKLTRLNNNNGKAGSASGGSQWKEISPTGPCISS